MDIKSDAGASRRAFFWQMIGALLPRRRNGKKNSAGHNDQLEHDKEDPERG
jgi:hypothetical protein